MVTTNDRMGGYEEWIRPAAQPCMPLCVSQQVEREISALARERGCQVHDLLIEAVELLLSKHGRPNIRALSEDQHLQVNIPTSVPTIDMLCESLQMTLEKLRR